MRKVSKVLKVGITGQQGFIGTHLYNSLGLYPERFVRVEYNKTYFESDHLLDRFVRECDVIIHLAGVNRSTNPDKIYNDNVCLTKKLVASLMRCKSSAHVLFSSSIQEREDNPYGKSKKQSRLLFEEWLTLSAGSFTGLLIPNVFGPFCKPFYNSVVATFCYQLTHAQEPLVQIDRELPLIYINELVDEILFIVDKQDKKNLHQVRATSIVTPSKILESLIGFRDEYIYKGTIPSLKDRFSIDLFNTFRSYIDPKNLYPIKFDLHKDLRGDFAEIIRIGEGKGGQVSFSITLPGATRGNHFHLRKIERFAVVSGEALIQMRRVGDTKVSEYKLSGDEPSYIDMPVWTIHNIKNIGAVPLYTIFWINEPYCAEDSDTYFQVV